MDIHRASQLFRQCCEVLFLFALLLSGFSIGILFTDKGNEIDNKKPPLIRDLLELTQISGNNLFLD